jgi:hypothetical protein
MRLLGEDTPLGGGSDIQYGEATTPPSSLSPMSTPTEKRCSATDLSADSVLPDHHTGARSVQPDRPHPHLIGHTRTSMAAPHISAAACVMASGALGRDPGSQTVERRLELKA